MKNREMRYESKDRRTSKKNKTRKVHDKEIVVVRRIKCTREHIYQRRRTKVKKREKNMTIDKEEREKNKKLAKRIVSAFNQKQDDETEEEYKERMKEKE